MVDVVAMLLIEAMMAQSKPTLPYANPLDWT